MATLVTAPDGATFMLADDGTLVPVTVAQSAPAAPVVAEAVYVSPYQRLTGPSARSARYADAGMQAAYDAAPDKHKQHAAREYAAAESVAGYSCDAAIGEWIMPDGSRRTVGHGFATHRDSGSACPTAGCKGTIR